MTAFDPMPIPPADPVTENRLPAKARKLLQDTRRAAEQWQAHAEETRLATRPAETDTVLDQYALIPIGLPPGERVTFKLGLLTEQDRHRDDWITARVVPDVPGRSYVEVAGPGLSCPLQVEPQSSNIIRVRLAPR